MIVGTRMVDGTIAHFAIDTSDYKIARNEVMWGLGTDCGEHTPILALIPDCGRDLKRSLVAHRVTGKDPLRGAMDVVTRTFEATSSENITEEDLPENKA